MKKLVLVLCVFVFGVIGCSQNDGGVDIGTKKAALTVYTVDTLDDDNTASNGKFSLREAIVAANANAGSDEIDFDSSLSGTIELEHGQMAITDSVVIEGPGMEDLRIDAQGESRIFRITGGVTVAISDLELAYGYATDAPGYGDYSYGYATGGAIQNFDGNDLTLEYVRFLGNIVIGPMSSQGGAIDNASSALTIDNCEFIENESQGEYLAEGGAISNQAAPAGESSTLDITDTLFEGNIADAPKGADQWDLEEWEDNDMAPVVGFLVGAGVGGAIRTTAGSDTTISYSEFKSNESLSANVLEGNGGVGASGGAILVADFSFFVAPIATEVNFSHTVFEENVATAGSTEDVSGVGSNAAGGAISFGAGLSGTFGVISSCDFIKNGTTGGDGGTPGKSEGAGIAVRSKELLIEDSVFEENQAEGPGDSNGGGLALITPGPAIPNPQPKPDVELTGCTFEGNSADGADSKGGAIYNGFEATTLLEESDVFDNEADGGISGYGGGLYNDPDGTFSLDTYSENNTVNNEASTSGDNFYGDFD